MPHRNWKPRHAPRCEGTKEFVRSAALALRTYRADPRDSDRGSWVCRPCQALERGTEYKYRLACKLRSRPAGYEELLQMMRDSTDRKIPGRQPKFVAQQGNAEALITARRAGRGGLAGPAKSRAMLVAAWRRRDRAGRWTPPAVELDLCPVCGKLLMRETRPGAKAVRAHQSCWWSFQRSDEGREWMAAYMRQARTGRRISGAERPVLRPGRSGKRSSPERLTRDFGWTVRQLLGNETFVELARSENLTDDAIRKAVNRIVELLPPIDIAGRTMRRYLVAFDEARGLTPQAPRPLRRSVAECGTQAGYKRHRRRGEPACELCSEAERERTRAYSEKRRREAGIGPRS